MAKKEQFYRRVKIAGMVSFIPVILATGPVAGYFAGDYLAKKLSLPGYIALLTSGICFVASVIEVVRIIKLVINTDKD